MIRVRKSDGTAVRVDTANAVEILDDEGRVSVAIIHHGEHQVKVLMPPDPLFTAYCNANGAKAVKKVNVIEPFDGVAMQT